MPGEACEEQRGKTRQESLRWARAPTRDGGQGRVEPRQNVGRHVPASTCRESTGGSGTEDECGPGGLARSPEREQARRAKLSIIAKQRGLGGYERGSGRGRKGWYRGIWCDSTYELAFVIWALDHEIPFERNLEVFPYEYDGRVLHWMPDLLLADGTYIEIKGYMSDQARAKFEYFLRPLTIFTRLELSRMFDYAHGGMGATSPPSMRKISSSEEYLRSSVKRTRLENVRGTTHRGFESHSLRPAT